MEIIKYLGLFIYAYCTDFVINLANILNLTYYEVNAIIFCIIWPLFTFVMILLNIYEYISLKKVNK